MNVNIDIPDSTNTTYDSFYTNNEVNIVSSMHSIILSILVILFELLMINICFAFNIYIVFELFKYIKLNI